MNWKPSFLYSSFEGEEFNLTEDLAWTFFHFPRHQVILMMMMLKMMMTFFPRHQHQFYLSAQYFAAEQLFLFYVMVWGGPEVRGEY